MIRHLRLAAAAPLLLATMSTGGAFIASGTAPGAVGLCNAATYAHRAALVVEHANGSTVRVCIGFDGSSITAEQVLQASGVEYATAGYGSLGDAVCQIDHEPSSYPPSCWTSTSPYWVLFVEQGSSSWTPAARGVSTQTLSDGDAAGFRYDPQNGPDPPPVSPAGTCASAASGAATTSSPATAASVPTAAAGAPQPTQNSATPAPSSTSAPIHAGVIGVSQPSTQTGARTAQSGVDPALLLAAAGGGLLAGLLVLQLIRRKRPAA